MKKILILNFTVGYWELMNKFSVSSGIFITIGLHSQNFLFQSLRFNSPFVNIFKEKIFETLIVISKIEKSNKKTVSKQYEN